LFLVFKEKSSETLDLIHPKKIRGRGFLKRTYAGCYRLAFKHFFTVAVGS